MATAHAHPSCDPSRPSDRLTTQAKKQAQAQALAQPLVFPCIDTYGPKVAAQIELQIALLMFASRGLALSRVRTTEAKFGEDQPFSYCSECHFGMLAGMLRHSASCHVGRVLDALDAICFPESVGQPVAQLARRKEDAPAAENARAEDGELPREFDEPWRAENWTNGAKDCLMHGLDEFVASVAVYLPREDREAIAARIGACVNFCAGISTERLEQELPLASAGRRRWPEVQHLRQALPWLGYLPVEADDSAVVR